MSKFRISELPLTDSEIINSDHKEFVEMLNQLIELTNTPGKRNEEEIDVGFEQLLQHVARHFAYEEEQMLRSNFPPYPIHKREHERIQKILKDSAVHWHLNRDRKIIKQLFEEVLPHWLVQHVATMDSVTARFLSSSGRSESIN